MDLMKYLSGMFKDYMPTDIDWADEQEFDDNGMPIPMSDQKVVSELEAKSMPIPTEKSTTNEGMLNTKRELRPEEKETQSIEVEPSEKPGYMMAEGTNFWSVNTDDPYWDTEEGYQEALELYGTSPAWSSRPMEQENNFVDLQPTKRISL